MSPPTSHPWKRITGLSKGNLSSHLVRLQDGGLVAVTKEFVDRVPRTGAALTPLGREQLAAHWRDLERLAREAAAGAPTWNAHDAY